MNHSKSNAAKLNADSCLAIARLTDRIASDRRRLPGLVPRSLLAALSVSLALLAGLHAPGAHAALDPRHAAWQTLLTKHVVVANDGFSSNLRYDAMKRDREALRAYLASLSAVTKEEYGAWPKRERLAFLINAYNAFTVDLILTRYPDLKSIKDLGSFLQSPWKKKFFDLLGQPRSLDEVEHEMIRAPGAFDDPRIHVAVVCASIGCPMLRKDAFTGEQIDAQLDDAMRRFLSDRNRNRFDTGSGTLAVSKIFDWYKKDFEQGHRGIDSLQTLFSRHADALTDKPPAQAEVRAGRYRIEYLDYDWALNDAARQP